MGRAGGKELDVAVGGMFCVGGGDIAVDCLELLKEFGEDFDPAVGKVDKVSWVVPFFKLGFVFFGAFDAVFEVVDEAFFEVIVCELLKEDGGEAHGELDGDVVEGAVADDIEDGEVGFGGGFIEPVFAVGPDAVPEYIGEMSMKNENETAYRHRVNPFGFA